MSGLTETRFAYGEALLELGTAKTGSSSTGCGSVQVNPHGPVS